MAEALSPRALTTIDDLIVFLDEDEHDAAIDPLLVKYVNAASGAIYRAAGGIEFVARNARFDVDDVTVLVDPEERIVDVTPDASGGGVTGVIRIGWLARLDAVTVTPVDYCATYSPRVIDVAADLVALPRSRDPEEPIRWLRFRRNLWAPSEVAITGIWGFPQIPADIRHYCELTVKLWLDRELSRHTTTYSLSEDRIVVPRTLPAEVFDGVRAAAKRWGVAARAGS